jgi:hypothetical protein
MECRKWEEAGLLYSAGELSGQETLDFEAHLSMCEECGNELRYYRSEREQFFNVGMLGEVPSASVDAEILRVCSDPRPKVRIAATALFTAFFKRQILVPAMLFIIGFISVGYIVMNSENARQMSGSTAAAVGTKVELSSVKDIDSLKDSLGADSKANFASTRGNINDNGVITVDLKK